MKTQSYILLFLLGLLSIIIIPLFLPNGGFVGDGPHYIRLAYYLPEVKWSLFPLGFPVFIKLASYFTQDYYWAVRFVNVLSYLAIGLFAYFKKFRFRETVLLLCTKIFFFGFFHTVSEGLFLTFMYFLFYYLYQFFNDNIKGIRFWLPAGILAAYLFSIRYTGLYIIFALLVFYLKYYWDRRNHLSFLNNDFAKFIIVSIAGILSYALFNYYNFGDFMGEGFRNKSQLKLFSDDFYSAIISLFNAFNPVLGIKFWSFSTATVIAEGVFWIINMIFIIFLIKMWRRSPKNIFYQLLMFIGLIYMLLMFVSAFFQGIEGLNTRMLCEAELCFFTVMIFLYFDQKRNEKAIFWLAVFSLAFNSLYVIKNPAYFPDRKKAVEKVFSKMKSKSYFFDDFAGKPKSTTYRIPVINKEFTHVHENLQTGPINGNIIMAKDPRINYNVKDTVRDKSKVIYNSEIESALSEFSNLK